MVHLRGTDALVNQAAPVLQSMNETLCREDNIPCQIEEGLFLGSLGAANNKETLENLNVTHILTVADSLPPKYPNDFVYRVLNVEDRRTTDLQQHFDECFNYIEEAKTSGGGVLVHCFSGKSRSATIVLSYLMKKHRMSLSEALEHVKEKRPEAAPNAGFIKQLKNLEVVLGISAIELPKPTNP
ncbi:putative phosphoric monoester hydrolase [Rosa chinensis]|uniref:Putative phosphoric monoester hydrolase n=1 Tax=Rosa chinensis TaxID=74649 RepID=A0A2P6QRN5_ROSCH|nr:dual specificity protein phosphatase 1 [Rosa chinensis]PRQ36849.1 putative phosphoric monoester hydrolase [Rosa chinensis]